MADDKHPVEYYDALERERKAKWHYKLTGKNRSASLSKGIKHDYESQLLKRGVKDSNGNQTPLRKEDIDLTEGMRKEIYDYANSSKKEAMDKATSFKGHPSEKHFHNAHKAYEKTMHAAQHAGDDNDVVKHVDRADRHFDRGLKMINNSELDPEGDDLHESRYHVVIGRYHNEPEVLSKHSSKVAAGKKLATAIKNIRDISTGHVLDTETGQKHTRNSILHGEEFVDALMTQDEIEYDFFREQLENRINTLVDAKKAELKAGLFDEGHTMHQLKQAAKTHMDKMTNQGAHHTSQLNKKQEPSPGSRASKRIASERAWKQE